MRCEPKRTVREMIATRKEANESIVTTLAAIGKSSMKFMAQPPLFSWRRLLIAKDKESKSVCGYRLAQDVVT